MCGFSAIAYVVASGLGSHGARLDNLQFTAVLQPATIVGLIGMGAAAGAVVLLRRVLQEPGQPSGR